MSELLCHLVHHEASKGQSFPTQTRSPPTPVKLAIHIYFYIFGYLTRFMETSVLSSVCKGSVKLVN